MNPPMAEPEAPGSARVRPGLCLTIQVFISLYKARTSGKTPPLRPSRLQGSSAGTNAAVPGSGIAGGERQFVTFRLADCLPQALHSEWEALLSIEEDRARALELEAYLDKGRGECHLKRPEIAGSVKGALRFFHGTRYELHAWVVMPNHVHVLFTQQNVPVGQGGGQLEILYREKEADCILGRAGQFWDEDYWDTYMRDEAQELARGVTSRTIRSRRTWRASHAQWR